MHIHIAPLYIALIDTLIYCTYGYTNIALMETLIIALIYHRYS